MARRKRRNLPPKRKTFAMIVDGKTEVWYFNMLKRNERNLRINIKPDLPTKKTLHKQYQYVLEASENNDKVFWILDFDTLIEETKKAKKGTETPIQEFEKYRIQIEKRFPNVVVIVNAPCLEFWFLLHFECTSQYFKNCDTTIKRLKKYIPDYIKNEKFFTRQNQDIYLKLKPHLKNAIANAQKLGDFDVYNPHQAMAQMHHFFLDNKLDNYFT